MVLEYCCKCYLESVLPFITTIQSTLLNFLEIHQERGLSIENLDVIIAFLGLIC